jgi:actin-related protein
MQNRAIGFDPGTAFLQVAEQKTRGGEITFKEIRNSFIELIGYETDDIEQILKQNNWQYITDGKHYYILGEDSLKVGRLFPNVEIRRPMQDGVLNKGEEKKMLVMSSMIENAIGEKATDNNSIVCFCVSSEVIDSKIDNIFHKARMEGMISRLGYKTKCIDEAMAIVLSERPCVTADDGTEIPYSGIAISFGAGRTNAVLAYRGLQILGMSCNRGGDYIDFKTSEQTNTPISQVVHTKENKLDFNNLDFNNDVLFCLDAFYSNLIEYVFKNFAKKFAEVKSQFESPLPIIIAGGTSMPKGFCEKIKSVISTLDLPFKIKDVVQSKDPRNSVVKGLLIQAQITQKKMADNKIEDALK